VLAEARLWAADFFFMFGGALRMCWSAGHIAAGRWPM
jgi:hypothetical protein